MKKHLLVLTLCLALLLLPGCAAMLERGHVSSTDHVDYAVEDDDESILRAETYQGLVNSMLYFVRGHRGGGTVRLYNYAGDVESDLAAAREAVLQDPIGAFAVRTLSYRSTRILTYYEVELTVVYAHSAQEVDDIPEVTGLAGVRQELARLVNGQEDSAVFLASYFSGDRSLVEELFLHSVGSAPALYIYPSGPAADLDYEIALYPETGTRRVVEVKVAWREGREESARRVEELEQTASALLEANPPEGGDYTVEELAAIVRAAHGGLDMHGSCVPLGALTGEPAQKTGLLLAMEYLCQQCGIEAVPVWGEGPETMWLIVDTPEGYRHLPPACLYGPEGEAGEEPSEPFRLYTDQELAGLGWEGDASLYPPCAEAGVEGVVVDAPEGS